MRTKGSRYETVPLFSSLDDGTVVFKGLRPRTIGPATGVVEHVVTATDRIDLLSRNYYNDDRLWWRILDANQDIVFAGELHDEDADGEVVLVPRPKESP
jgi:hypothetical protein